MYNPIADKIFYWRFLLKQRILWFYGTDGELSNENQVSNANMPSCYCKLLFRGFESFEAVRTQRRRSTHQRGKEWVRSRTISSRKLLQTHRNCFFCGFFNGFENPRNVLTAVYIHNYLLYLWLPIWSREPLVKWTSITLL